MEKKIAHVHELIEILISDSRTYSRDEFTEMISDKFGSDILFTSCSDKTFDINEVPSFLLSRDKIIIENDRISPHPSLSPCNH